MKRFLKYMVTGATFVALPFFPASSQDTPENPNLYPDARYLAPINPEPGEIAFDFQLKGTLFGIKVASARFKGVYDDKTYSVYSDMKTAGLGALVKKQRIWATTEGKYNKADVKPRKHIQQNLNKKSRRVEMQYSNRHRKVKVKVRPPNGSQGIPPATPQQQFESDDVISAIFKIVLTGNRMNGRACDDNVKVFDSKQHYNLRLERAGIKDYEYEGVTYPAIKCHVYYEPISGFDPEDLPSEEEAGTPVTLYLIDRPEYGIHMPVKLTYKISGFKAVIKIKNAEIIKN